MAWNVPNCSELNGKREKREGTGIQRAGSCRRLQRALKTKSDMEHWPELLVPAENYTD